MADVGQIFEYLNELAPVELKMDFDNVGLLVGNADDKVDKCLVALDITDEVIEEAVYSIAPSDNFRRDQECYGRRPCRKKDNSADPQRYICYMHAHKS